MKKNHGDLKKTRDVFFCSSSTLCEELADGGVGMGLHVTIDGLHMRAVEDAALHDAIDNPLNAAEVTVTLFGRGLGNLCCFCCRVLDGRRSKRVLGRGEKAEQIEGNAVGYDVGALHGLTLPGTIAITQIKGIVGTQILVERNAQHIARNDDTLVEGAYLCIDVGQADVGHQTEQTLKGIAELAVDIAHIGILTLDIGQQHLQGGILIEVQKMVVNLRLVDTAQMQHILNEGSRLLGVLGVHLLKGREVASGEIERLHTVVTADREEPVGIVVGIAETPVTAQTEQHRNEQKCAKLAHQNRVLES